MLSGIGPAEHLREAGVEPRVEIPEVGENLQDHPYSSASGSRGLGGTPARRREADARSPSFLLRRTGLLTSNVAEGSLFTRTRAGLPAADLQFHFGPVFFVDHGFDEHERPRVLAGPVLVTPKSRGQCASGSADPRGEAADPGQPPDRARGRRDAGRRGQAGPARSPPPSRSRRPRARELFPGPEVEDDDEAIEADIRRRVELTYHPVGTCRMGVRRRRRRRSRAARARRRRPAGRRRLGDAADPRRQHPRLDGDDRGEGLGPDPRKGCELAEASSQPPRDQRAMPDPDRPSSSRW